MNDWWICPVLALAGATGALARYGLAELARRRWEKNRLGVTLANMLGATLAGGLVAIDHPVSLLLAAGFAGSLTTFSTIVSWIATDVVDRQPLAAVRIAVIHIVVGIPAGFAGFAATTAVIANGLA